MSSVDCCPECHSTDYYTVVGTGNHHHTTLEHRYACNDCGAKFQTLDTREGQTGSTPRTGLAATLDATDPDAIGGDNDD